MITLHLITICGAHSIHKILQLREKAIPSYFLSPHIGRFDDIWGSYFLKRVADYFDDAISFGFPLVKQDRNDHNLWHDLDLELFGNQNTETFVEWLRIIKPVKHILMFL